MQQNKYGNCSELAKILMLYIITKYYVAIITIHILDNYVIITSKVHINGGNLWGL